VPRRLGDAHFCCSGFSKPPQLRRVLRCRFRRRRSVPSVVRPLGKMVHALLFRVSSSLSKSKKIVSIFCLVELTLQKLNAPHLPKMSSLSPSCRPATRRSNLVALTLLSHVAPQRPRLALPPPCRSGASEARRDARFFCSGFTSPRSTTEPCVAVLDVGAEAYQPASPDLVVFEPIVPSVDATLVKFAALTVLSLAAS